MKKLSALLLALLLITTSISLASCDQDSNDTSSTDASNADTASKDESTVVEEFDYDAYETALDATNDLSSMHAYSNTAISYKQSGVGIEASYDAEIFISLNGENGVHALAEIAMTAFGEETDTAVYYNDGYSYSTLLGIKMKEPSTLYDSISSNLIMDLIPEEAILETSSEKVESVVLHTLVLDVEEMVDSGISEMLVKQIVEFFPSEEYTGELTEMTIIVAYDDEYLLYHQVITSFKITSIEDEEFVIECNIDNIVNIINPGEDVEIDVPTDLDEYLDAGEFGEEDYEDEE